jgi:hypothetical protein
MGLKLSIQLKYKLKRTIGQGKVCESQTLLRSEKHLPIGQENFQES